MNGTQQGKDGYRQLTGGVIASWGAQLVQIASGFIIPRWIDHGLGRETLGIWDLAWSVVSYLSLLEAGVGSSVNRHVALYRAKGDFGGVNRVVSSVAILQRGMGALVFALAIGIAALLPAYLRTSSPAVVTDAKWLVVILGASIAFSLSSATYIGVLTGYHQWTVHYAIAGSTRLAAILGMCSVLETGFGVVALAVVYLSCEIVGRIVRVIVAYRMCPQLSVRLRNVDRATMRAMSGFGGRMFIGQMSGVLMVQTINMLIAGHLGPAALALFARPRGLICQAAVFPQKYAFMLTPASAALSARRSRDELRRFVTEATRYGVCMAVPIMVFLGVDGGPLLKIWMGKAYADTSLILLLTLAFTAEIVYQPLNTLLLGLNLHGRPGVFSFVAAICAAFATWLVLKFGGGLNAVAIAIGIPWSVVNGIYLPCYVCRRLDMSLPRFIGDVWTTAIISAVPFALALFGAQLVFPNGPVLALTVGSLIGGILLLALYWRWVIPESAKESLRSKLGIADRAKPIGDISHQDLEPDLVAHDQR